MSISVYYWVGDPRRGPWEQDIVSSGEEMTKARKRMRAEEPASGPCIVASRQWLREELDNGFTVETRKIQFESFSWGGELIFRGEQHDTYPVLGPDSEPCCPHCGGQEWFGLECTTCGAV